jgi:hypothetical protein
MHDFYWYNIHVVPKRCNVTSLKPITPTKNQFIQNGKSGSNASDKNWGTKYTMYFTSRKRKTYVRIVRPYICSLTTKRKETNCKTSQSLCTFD